ncbi:expressed unknown protein [Seminavis robusta]|uniref:Uncharacterized protein n=1 Tax=Seminavis robusta TaxID=568900 RepID=A0A9N8H691_9STRA|nr:expressed unknown protein [Seminavis robusta]|eukprot:Sro139_g065010.1 n/a (105) ;mRNA; r:25216-25530
MVHLTLAPYRLVCFGVSSSFCRSSFSNEDGMPYYAYYGLELLRIVNGIQNVVLRSVGLAMIMGVTGAFRAAEVMFGASLAPLVIGILFFVSYRKKNQQNKTKAL